MDFDTYPLGLIPLFCLFLSIAHQSDGVSSLSSNTEPTQRSLLAKLQAMEKSALAKKLEGAGLHAKETGVLAKALKGTELKGVEKPILDKAIKEAGLQELEKSALTKAMKGASKNLLSMRNFEDDSEPEKNQSKSENVIDIKTSTPGAETTMHSLSNITTMQLLNNESSYISHLLNESLALAKDMDRNETDDSNSTILIPTKTVNISSIADPVNETVDRSMLIYPHTQDATSTSDLPKSVLDNSSISLPHLDLNGTYLNKINLDNETINATLHSLGQGKLENNSTETSRNATEIKIKDSIDKESYIKMEISDGKKNLTIHVHPIDSWHYLSNAAVSVISHDTRNINKEINIMKLKHLNVLEGTIERDTKAYVLGSIENGLFYGYIFSFQGKLLYVNKSTVMSTDIFNATLIEHRNCNSTDELCHALKLLETYDCVHEGQYGILCSLGKDLNDTSFKENSTKSYHPHFVPKHKTSVYCSVVLEADPSYFVDRHNRSVPDTAREMLIAFLFANHVLQHTDLNGDGEANKIHLRLSGIKLHEDNGTRALRQGKVMAQYLEKLSKEPQDNCLILKFISEDLPEEEPLSIGFRGGMCMDNINQTEPAENVAVINLHRPEGQLSNFSVSWVTLRTIGQVMGSDKTSCKKPDALTSLKDWRRFFSVCEGNNIAETLVLRGFCLKNFPALQHRFPEDKDVANGIPECGDGIVDLGEECDCGSVMECRKKRHCCVPPGQTNQCKIDRSKGYKCSLHQPCCSVTCKIIPESMHVFCGGGDPECSSHQAFCSGQSAECPVVPELSKAFDGKTCGRGLMGVCSGGFCTYVDCVKNGWPNCKCNASQGRDCMVCCEKNKQCLSALYLPLPMTSSVMFRKMGMQCGDEMDGKCDAYGECVHMKHVGNAANKEKNYWFSFRGLCMNLINFFGFLYFMYSITVILP